MNLDYDVCQKSNAVKSKILRVHIEGLRFLKKRYALDRSCYGQ